MHSDVYNVSLNEKQMPEVEVLRHFGKTIKKGNRMQNKLYPQTPKKTNGNCPTCGFHISHSSAFDNVLAGQFDNVREGSYVATRVTPVRASTFQSDVAVPAAQSLIWSIVVALPAIPVSYALRHEWYIPLVVSSISMLVSWISVMRRSDKSQSKIEEFSYHTDERQTGKMLSKSSGAGIRLDVTDRPSGSGVSTKIAHLPVAVSDEQFVSLCREVLAGKSLARSNWTGSGKMFSRDVYDRLVAEMVHAGLIFSLPGKGKTLTTGGKHAIERMLRDRQDVGQTVDI